MESRAILAERPVHPLLAFFPLGLFAASLVMDLIRVFSLDGNWSITSYYMIGAGVIGALLAAVFGFVDWMSIPVPTRAKSMGMWRLLARVAVAGRACPRGWGWGGGAVRVGCPGGHRPASRRWRRCYCRRWRWCWRSFPLG